MRSDIIQLTIYSVQYKSITKTIYSETKDCINYGLDSLIFEFDLIRCSSSVGINAIAVVRPGGDNAWYF